MIWGSTCSLHLLARNAVQADHGFALKAAGVCQLQNEPGPESFLPRLVVRMPDGEFFGRLRGGMRAELYRACMRTILIGVGEIPKSHPLDGEVGRPAIDKMNAHPNLRLGATSGFADDLIRTGKHRRIAGQRRLDTTCRQCRDHEAPLAETKNVEVHLNLPSFTRGELPLQAISLGGGGQVPDWDPGLHFGLLTGGARLVVFGVLIHRPDVDICARPPEYSSRSAWRSSWHGPDCRIYACHCGPPGEA